MSTWLNSELPEAWPEHNNTSTSSAEQMPTTTLPTVAIQPDGAAQEAQWKQHFSPERMGTNATANHLNQLFNEDQSSLESLESSVSEQTRKLKLFTDTKNTYTNIRLDALTTSLQGHKEDSRHEDSKIDVIGDLMNDGQNVLSKIRKASNLDMRAEFQDSSLEDLKHLDEPSNGSTLSDLSTTNTTSQRDQQVNTVRFKTPVRTRSASISELGIGDLNLEQKPSMSFVQDDVPATSASESSLPHRQVRREMYARPGNTSSASTSVSREFSRASFDPRPQSQLGRQQYASQASSVPSAVPAGAPGPQHQGKRVLAPNSRQRQPQQPSVRIKSKQQYGRASSQLKGNANSTIDRVFDVSIAVNAAPLRDLSLPQIPENTSISRKNISFSGSLANIIHQVQQSSDVHDFEIDLSGLHLECIQGLEELLPDLGKVDLSNNNLQVLGGLSPSLLEVDLSHNQLNRITTFPLSFITTLDISNNQLTNLAGLSQLRALSYLDVSSNELSSLKGIQNLFSLTTLCADNNKLRSIEISHPKLQHLKASNNTVSAIALNTPQLETLVLDNNQIFACEAVPSVKLLSVCNNRAHFDFSGWSSLEQVFYDGNPIAQHLEKASPIALSWIDAKCQGFDAYCAVNTSILSLGTMGALSSLAASAGGPLPIQQLDLVGVNLTSIPNWLANKFPVLECLNLALNKLQDKDLHALGELKSLKTLGLFGNKLESLNTVTACLSKLPHLGAIDLRGNPATHSLYPDVKTLLLEHSQQASTQYKQLLQLEWDRVMEEWRHDSAVSAQFDNYYKQMRQLRHLWWLDGVVLAAPGRSNYFAHPYGHGLGSISPDSAAEGDQINEHAAASLSQIHSVVASIAASANSTLPNVTEDFDMRHEFATPANNLTTPSRVNGTIGTIGKMAEKAASAFHSTPAPATFAGSKQVREPTAIPMAAPRPSMARTMDTSMQIPVHQAEETVPATPQMGPDPDIRSRPLAKSMSRTRKTPYPLNHRNTIFSPQPAQNNEANAKLIAELLISVCRQKYDSRRR